MRQGKEATRIFEGGFLVELFMKDRRVGVMTGL
jgi:hypothetical protein